MPFELAAAGLSAVASLVGGRKAAKEQRRAIAEQNAYNHPSAIRARAEEAGFNPVAFIGPGVGTQTSIAQPVMGQAIANAGLALADGLNKFGETKAYASQLEEQNAELRKALDGATLRPNVPGIYGPVGRGVPQAGVASPVVLQARGAASVDPGETPIEHKWIKVWDDRERRFTWYPNPDLMDAGPTEMATGMATIGAAESAQHGLPGGFDFMFDRTPDRRSMGMVQEKPWVSFKKPGADNPKIPRIKVEK